MIEDGKSTTNKQYSYYSLFYARQEQLAGAALLVLPALFRDKIVLVGTTAAGLHDVFAVPFSSGGKMPGSQIHASVIDQLLSSRFIEPAPKALGAALVVATAFVTALLIEFLPLRWAGPSALLVLSTVIVMAFQAFTRGPVRTDIGFNRHLDRPPAVLQLDDRSRREVRVDLDEAATQALVREG